MPSFSHGSPADAGTLLVLRPHPDEQIDPRMFSHA
jgi:hypothetical protein